MQNFRENLDATINCFGLKFRPEDSLVLLPTFMLFAYLNIRILSENPLITFKCQNSPKFCVTILTVFGATYTE